MAVTEVGTPTLYSNSDSTSFSVSRTVTSGSKGLSVQLSYYNGPGSVAPPTLTWNGTETMTLVASAASVDGGDKRAAVYFLANPTAGTFNVTGTFSGTSAWMSVVREWSNASSVHGGNSAASESSSPSVNVASVVSGEVTIDAMIAGGQPGNPTVGAGQNTTNLYLGNLVGPVYAGSSTDPSSTGTVAMNWTLGDGNRWAIAAMALVEDAGGGGGSARSYYYLANN